MSYPIIFIHQGNSWYLPYTLWQCRVTNPQADIFLIGDNTTKHFNGIVKHIPIAEYRDAGEKLREVYVHKSGLGASFELPCIERWFILYAFLQRNNLDNCIYLDSDILVYDNLANYTTVFSSHDMTWCSYSAHVNFITNIAALNQYCRLVIDSYTGAINPTFKAKSLFSSSFQHDSNQYISDMTFFYDYNSIYPGSLRAINIPRKDVKCFDTSMEDIKIFKADKVMGFKLVEWEQRQPFCILKEHNFPVPMAVLHFQGKAKHLIKNYFRYPSVGFYTFKIKSDMYIQAQKFARMLSRLLKAKIN